MSTILNLDLTDELRAFVEENSGKGALYSTPSEFVCSVLREKKERLAAATIRDAILSGYQDAAQGRTVTYQGDLRKLLRKRDGHRSGK